MQKININKLKSGMIMSRNIFAADGELVIGAGTELTDQHIERLASLNYVSVYAVEPLYAGDSHSVDEDVVSEELRVETIRQVREAFQEAAEACKIDMSKVAGAVHDILQEILANEGFLYKLVDIRSNQDYLFGHSVNVCLLSLMTGLTLGYSESRLKELGIGALLHDLGHSMTPAGLLEKGETLTPDEIRVIRQHPVKGFDILRKQRDISLLSAHIAFQHHERWDGNGYPRRLRKTEIHEYARIVAAADVFDALHSDRPYRSAYTLEQCVKIMRGLAGTHLDPHCVEALLANVAVYEPGCLVELSNGSLAVVIGNNKGYPGRPRVQVIYDGGRKATRKRHTVDLQEYSTVFIRRIITRNEMTSMVAGRKVD